MKNRESDTHISYPEIYQETDSHDTLSRTKILIREKIMPMLEKQTIIHCRCVNHSIGPMSLRIWPTTFLVDRVNGKKYKLLHVEGITLYPEWVNVYSKTHTFTLIFEGLERSCKIFSLLEQIPEPGEFHVKDIKRNEADVYNVNID
jgi:hypothetical protein